MLYCVQVLLFCSHLCGTSHSCVQALLFCSHLCSTHSFVQGLLFCSHSCGTSHSSRPVSPSPALRRARTCTPWSVWRWTPYPNPVSYCYALLNNFVTIITTWFIAVYYYPCCSVMVLSFQLRSRVLPETNCWHIVQGKWTEFWLRRKWKTGTCSNHWQFSFWCLCFVWSFHLYNTYRISSYLTENILSRHYKYQPVSDACGNNRYVARLLGTAQKPEIILA